MALQKKIQHQRDFSAGQLDDTAMRRDDLDVFKAALRLAENVRPIPTGGVTRRPGRSIVYFDGGRHDIVRPTADVVFDVTFAAARFTARLRSGAVVTTLVAPWTADMLAELSWVALGRKLYVCHTTMQPQVLEYDRDAGTWSIATYTFRTGLDGTYAAPFYRFADFGETMQPSALSGTTTLTTSADVFVAGHVGTMFEYGGRQVLINAVTDARHATATCLETLPPVWRATVGDTSSYKVGEIVEGDTTGTIGEVMAINSSTVFDIFVTKNYGGFSNGETIVGSNASSIVASSTKVGPAFAATVQWKEQFLSNVRGWPGSVSQGFARLCFCDFDQLEEAILWSSISEPDNLKLTGAADAAMLETVPTVCRVLHVAGTADLFVLTDRTVHYIPISASNPLQPGAVEFRPLGTAGASRVKPVEIGDGLVFIGATLPLVWAVTPNGSQTRPYDVKKLNELAQKMFNAPVAVASSAGQTDTNPEQHLFVVNADGTVVIGHGTIDGSFIGWFPWTSEALVTDVCGFDGDVIFTSRYTLNDATTVDTVESLDATRYLDGCVDLIDFVGTDPLRDSTGDPILDSTGEAILAAGGALVPFANETLQGWDEAGFYLGDLLVDANGRVDLTGRDLTAVYIGWNFTPRLKPFFQDFDSTLYDLGQRLRRRKIIKSLVTVKDSNSFKVGNKVVNSYRVGEDMGAAPPSRDGTFRFGSIGRAYDPDYEISQPTPGKFTLIAFSAETTL